MRIQILVACAAAALGGCAQNQTADNSDGSRYYAEGSSSMNGDRSYYSDHDRNGTPERAYYEDGKEPD